MKQKDIAKELGVTQQHLYFTLRGERNFSLQVSRKFAGIVGGDVLLWMDSERVDERRRVWDEFMARTKKAK